MLRFFLGACLLALSASAHAQTLQGQITDGETGDPLPGAAVFLPTLNLGTTTNTEGRYTLALSTSGTFRVVYSFVGHKTETRSVTLAPDGVTTLDLVLTPSFVEVGDVTVTARAQASDVLTVPQSVAIVDAAMLDRLASGTPMDALDEVAGVRLLRTGPAIAKPVIRGLTAQRVLVVADGVRQEGQGWGDEHGPEIGSADVDRIEVVRGPLSLLYGSDALGGVVQTTHTDLFAYDTPLGGDLAVLGLTGSQQGAGELTLGGRTGDWAYEARGGMLQAGQVQTPDGLIPNTAQENGTISGRLGYRFAERGRVVVSGGTFRNELGLFEPEFLEEGEDPGLDRYEIGEPSQRIAHDRVGLRADLPLGLHRLELVTAVQQNRRREFGEHGHGGEEAKTSSQDGEEDEEPELFLRLTTSTADVRLHHRPVGRLFGTIGVSGMLQENETLAEETLIPGATTLNGAVYVTEQLVLPRFTVDAGLRFDARSLDVDASEDLGVEAQTRSYTALTGALGAAWQPRGDLSIAANLGRAFRAPQLIELFGDGVHEGTLRYERGDADLMPETALSLDGVIRYLTPHLYAEVSGFVNTITDYIYPSPTVETDPESGFVIYDFAQSDARLVGAEFRLDIHPHALHGLGLHVSGDVTDGTNQDTNDPLPFVPPARLRTAIEYKAERLGPAQDFALRFGPTWTASQDRPGLVEEVATDAFTVWEVSVSASLTAGGLTVTPVLGVDNLFDAAYVDPLSRFRPYGVFAPGRSVRFRVQVGF